MSTWDRDIAAYAITTVYVLLRETQHSLTLTCIKERAAPEDRDLVTGWR